MLETMKKKTYHNFLVVRNLLMREKGYEPRTAERITHLIFENYQLDSSRTIRDYYDRVIPREEFEMQQYGSEQVIDWEYRKEQIQ